MARKEVVSIHKDVGKYLNSFASSPFLCVALYRTKFIFLYLPLTDLSIEDEKRGIQ
jgi:hypothetical protein